MNDKNRIALTAACWLVATSVSAGASAQTAPPAFSTAWDYQMYSTVLAQLESTSRNHGTAELTELIERIRISVPFRSARALPNAYAEPVTSKENWITIERRWANQVAGFAELGALHALSNYGSEFAQMTRDISAGFCKGYQTRYRQAERARGEPPVYQFRFSNFTPREQPGNALMHILFDKVTGLVGANALVWTVLHEVAHHALKHTVEAAPDNAARRQRELDADAWAFQYMQKLGYSVFGATHFFVARATTEACIAELGFHHPADGTHPSWSARLGALKKTFDTLAAPGEGVRVIFIPWTFPEPGFTTVTIPDAASGEFDATIVQRGKATAGIAEWRGKSVTVYMRNAQTGGRSELVIADVTRVALRIDQRMYDADNRLVGSPNTQGIQGIQQEQAGLDFLEVGGYRFGDLRRRWQGNNLQIVHLRRAGASEAMIQEVLAETRRYNGERQRLGLGYLTGKNDFQSFSSEMQAKAAASEQRLAAILGTARYNAYMKSYKEEVKSVLPPLTGVGGWEEAMIRKLFGGK